MVAIDTHVHFWKFDAARDTWITSEMRTLKQDYLPQHLELSFKRNEITGCVAVQAAPSELETHFLIELAKSHSIIKGVVGWVNLEEANIEDRLVYFKQYPVIKGFRYQLQDMLPGFMEKATFRRGIEALGKHGFTYDLLVKAHQLTETIDLVKAFPNQPFVLDHCAKPDIRKKSLADWAVNIRELAALPNVHCKLSGLLTEADWKQWSPGEFYPYLDVVYDAFGPTRLMFGSDWPVMLLSGIYVQWKSLLEKFLEEKDIESQEQIFYTNAQNFYGI